MLLGFYSRKTRNLSRCARKVRNLLQCVSVAQSLTFVAPYVNVDLGTLTPNAQTPASRTVSLHPNRNDRNINVVEKRIDMGAVFRQHGSIPALRGLKGALKGKICDLCQKDAVSRMKFRQIRQPTQDMSLLPRLKKCRKVNSLPKYVWSHFV